jgi:chlorobactene glucosyltransferase
MWYNPGMLEILLWIGAGVWLFFFAQLLVNRLLIESLSHNPVPTADGDASRYTALSEPKCPQRPVYGRLRAFRLRRLVSRAPDHPRYGRGYRIGSKDLRDVSQEIPGELPFVSIVVPARNEERKIRAAVSSFCRQEYPSFEVVVVDDCSEDGTPEILEELKAQFPNLTVVRGSEPPEGWLGKPHALEEGRKAAGGEWLLFVDADVVYDPSLLRKAVAYALHERAAMLALWPDLEAGGAVEAAVMSEISLACAVFPIFMVNRSASKLAAAGGGVFNLVRRDALEASGAFGCLKSAVVDDIGLGYKVKGAGFRVVVAFAGSLIRIRMYESAADAIDGFTKNVYPAFRRVPWLLPIFGAAGIVVNFLPYYGFASALFDGRLCVPALIALVFMHAVFGGLVRFFRQHWAITFLNPVRELLWWWICIRSFAAYCRKGLTWRGRRYGFDAKEPRCDPKS